MNNKKKYYILLFFFSFLFLTFTQILYYGNRLDYYWNYNNSLQIANGLIPYKDINIITTPLFHFITSIILYIFGKNIIVYASFMSILKILHIILLSKIVSILLNNKKEKNSFNLFTYIIGILFIFNAYYEYNLLSIFFITFIIYLELNNKNDFKTNFIIGSLAAFSFLTKQSIGIFAILFVTIKPLLFKNNKKYIVSRLFGVFIPNILFFLYLVFTDSFDAFINYAILGLKDFNNGISILNSIKIEYNISNNISLTLIFFIALLLIFIIFIIYLIKQMIKKKDDRVITILYYSIISISCFYPIRDLHHFIPVILSFIPLMMYYLIKNIKFNFISNKIVKIVLIIIGIETALMPIYMYFSIYTDNEKEHVVLKDNYSSINGMVVKRTLKDNIDEIIKFENKNDSNNIKTIILNKSSVLFHLSQNKYYKDYDLFMRGNFGENGEDKLINEIKESENTIYLVNMYDYIENRENYNQIPKKVIKYVTNNLKNTDKVLSYEVYEK